MHIYICPLDLHHTLLQIVEFAVGIFQPILTGLKPTHNILDNGDKAVSRLWILPRTSFHSLSGWPLVPTEFPKHAAPQTLLFDVLALQLSDFLTIEADHLLLCRVIGPTPRCFLIHVDCGSRQGQYAIVVHTVLPSSWTQPRVRCSRAFSIEERTAIKRNAKDKLLALHAFRYIVVNRGGRANGTPVYISLMICNAIPGPG